MCSPVSCNLFPSSNIPKDFSTLCWRAVRSVFKSLAYCCSNKSCRFCSSRCCLCSWSALVLRIRSSSSCRSWRLSCLTLLVCWLRQSNASYRKQKRHVAIECLINRCTRMSFNPNNELMLPSYTEEDPYLLYNMTVVLWGNPNYFKQLVPRCIQLHNKSGWFWSPW